MSATDSNRPGMDTDFLLRIVFSCKFGAFHGGAPLRFLETEPVHVPIVPMSIKAPVVGSMVYIETSLERLFVT